MDLLPVFSIVVNVDIDCSSKQLLFFIELWCSDSKVLPSLENKKETTTNKLKLMSHLTVNS